MAYSERDFLDGLAAGLTATAGNFNGSKIVYYIHIEEPGNVHVHIALHGGAAYVDWGDGSQIERSGSGPNDPNGTYWNFELIHHFQSGNYTITLVTDAKIKPSDNFYIRLSALGGSSHESGVYLITDRFYHDDRYGEVHSRLYSILRGACFFGHGVTRIEEGAFRYCSALTSVTIGDHENIYIRDSAFRNCASLTSVTIGDGVTTIGQYAFNGCSKLASVTIGDGAMSIGFDAFRNCASLTSVTKGDGAARISDGAFYGCRSLASVMIPGTGITMGITWHIGSNAFTGCSSLVSVTIPDCVTFIGEDAFNGCSSLASVTIPDRPMWIGQRAFQNTLLRSVTINRNTAVGSDAFPSGCEINYY